MHTTAAATTAVARPLCVGRNGHQLVCSLPASLLSGSAASAGPPPPTPAPFALAPYHRACSVDYIKLLALNVPAALLVLGALFSVDDITGFEITKVGGGWGV